MIVDSSAVLAVLLHETDAKRYAGVIMTATPCRMSVAECRMSVKAERPNAMRRIHAAGGPSAREDLAASRAPCKETR